MVCFLDWLIFTVFFKYTNTAIRCGCIFIAVFYVPPPDNSVSHILIYEHKNRFETRNRCLNAFNLEKASGKRHVHHGGLDEVSPGQVEAPVRLVPVVLCPKTKKNPWKYFTCT